MGRLIIAHQEALTVSGFAIVAGQVQTVPCRYGLDTKGNGDSMAQVIASEYDGRAASGYDGQALSVGDRIELHPATDLWMRGARFGVIVGIAPTADDRVRVKLDRVARTFSGSADTFRRVS